MTGSPFGKFAAVVAAIVALGILGTWLASLGGLIPASPDLTTAALFVLGIVFGVGAGASAVSNGASQQAVVANTRLDAIGAPSAGLAHDIVHTAAIEAATHPPAAPPPAPGPGPTP
jgi:hypothetical protein